MTTPSIVQVVQHLRPGGIETMALDLLDRQTETPAYLISLEGSAEQAMIHWPRLRDYFLPYGNPPQNDLPHSDLPDDAPEHKKPEPETSRYKQRRLPRIIFLNKPPGRSYLTLARLCWQLKRLNAGAVHTHHIGPLFYGGLAARVLGIPCRVHTEHDSWHLQNSHNRRLQQWLLNRVRPTLVADCQAVANSVAGHFPHQPVEVIRNGIDSRRFTPANTDGQRQSRQLLGLPEQARIIGCAARLEPVKAIDNLIQALVWLDDDVHLALAGDGSQRDILGQLCKDLQLQSRVHFLGALDCMPCFYRSLDLFCLPSRCEGLPLSPLEAQACNIPVVVTDVGGCREILCPHSSQCIAPDNPGALRLALEHGLHERMNNRSNKTPRDLTPRDFVVQQGDLQHTAAAYQALLTRRDYHA
ncbi:MAG: glycosyltransferase [Marinobacterium sp.]|nr:glycosyltransferase [Marinobacterium sp.]